MALAYNLEIKRKAIQLRKEGLSLKDITERLQAPVYSTVQCWLKDRGIRLPVKEKLNNHLSFEEIKLVLFKWAYYFSRKVKINMNFGNSYLLFG